MSDAKPPADEAQRTQALEVARSFIVQAPAGSGKTELLVQRYLALLATVEAPEEVVAITFTRKAAGEMRQRVLEALLLAGNELPPGEPHRSKTWSLARAVLHRDHSHNWGLMEGLARLRIQTFDSLCASLCRQMPLLAGFGSQYKATKDPLPLYIEAARRTLALLHEDARWAAHIGPVLAHLDNDFAAAETLFVGMLPKRDQWLRHVADRESSRLDRRILEQGLAHVIEDALAELVALFPAECEQDLVVLSRFAASNLEAHGKSSPVRALLNLASLPGAQLQDRVRWQGVAALLLKQDGSPRRSANLAVGFPSPSRGPAKLVCDEHKARFRSLLEKLTPLRDFLEALHALREMPPERYTDAQWRALGALMDVLPLAAAQLNLVFQEKGRVDFTAISQAALRALGAQDAPTDLALSLDYRIRHLLVDEFQDTSQTQYELIERLTAGWQQGDGRTMFVVGDPMQSIYRFREAEVGLYLRARSSGIGTVKLTPLTLCANFRSQAGLVNWCNECFSRVLPRTENLASGAVPFSRSEAFRAGLPIPPVTVHPLAGDDRQQESKRVLHIIEEALRQGGGGRIAILVGSRSHVASILPALRHAGAAVQAIEIESLADRPVVMDLTALTRALTHPADRVAWLAVLRAPWCGLALADLEAVASAGGRPHDRPILDSLRSAAVLESLSEDGRERAMQLASKLSEFVEDRQRQSARRWVEGAWTTLGGPASYEDSNALADAQVFFELLDASEDEGPIDPDRLTREVDALFARAVTAEENAIQVMTIHKAKGLGFDTVILPGLGYKRAQDAQQLLRWMERPRPRGSPDLLLAPLGRNHRSEDPIYRALSIMERARARHEEIRLLYVAATRAKSHLHLLGHLNADTRVRVRDAPNPGSLLAHLWPVIGHHFEAVQGSAPVIQPAVRGPRVLRRRAVHWNPPGPRGGLRRLGPSPPPVSRTAVEFSWASETARIVGMMVHRVLQRIAEDGVETWTSARVEDNKALFARDLRGLGLPETEIPAALARTREAVLQVVGDPRGLWLLSRHEAATSELQLTGLVEGQLVTVAIDRTFVDDQGARWIVDFKTGTHQGADLAQFLDREQARYREQLERYAVLVRNLGEQHPIRLGLYFPMLRQWREWEPESRIKPV